MQVAYLTKNRHAASRLLDGHRSAALLENTSLFPGDFVQRVTENLSGRGSAKEGSGRVAQRESSSSRSDWGAESVWSSISHPSRPSLHHTFTITTTNFPFS